MLFLYENVAPIVVAAVASVVAWLFGGARGDLLTPVAPWLILFMLEVLVCFPQRSGDESTYEARERVWKTLKRSPLFWVSFSFVLYLLIPFVNNGLCPDCDAALIAQGISPKPPISKLPSCVNRIDHLNVVFWFSLSTLAAVIVNVCMRRRGKRRVLELIVWNGVALAALGLVQSATQAAGPFWCTLHEGAKASPGAFFSSFGYPNMAGDYFTLLFGISVALWRDRYEHLYSEERKMGISEREIARARRCQRFWKKHYFILPAGVFFFSALYTLSRAAIILVTVTASIYFVHTLMVLLSRMSRTRRLYVGVWSVIGFALLVFFASIFMPDNLRREIGSLDNRAMLDRVTGKSQFHTTIAMDVWKSNKLYGCGGWGYMHLCRPTMRKLGITNADDGLMIGGANVHNDLLQFLAEHGVVGCGALLAIMVLMLGPVCAHWRELIRDLRFKKQKELPPKPIAIFALPSPVFVIMVALSATLVHSFGDCPLRSCAVLMLFFIAVAALPGFMPKREMRPRHRH